MPVSSNLLIYKRYSNLSIGKIQVKILQNPLHPVGKADLGRLQSLKSF